MYSDLEVFVLTYNRADYLKETLISLCNQTAKGFDIIVLDNGSTDNTFECVEQIKKQFPDINIDFRGADKNHEQDWNFNRAFIQASKKWTMIFHDDDLIHPDYIKHSMDLLNNTEDSVMASCACESSVNPVAKWKELKNDAYIVDVKGFVSLLLGYSYHSFSSTIYRTDLIKQISLDRETYGKICDRPFMVEIAKQGTSIVLKNKYIEYRIHPGQDSNTEETGPFIRELFNLLKLYKSVLGNNWFDKYGAIYNALIYDHLKMGYYWIAGAHKKMTFKEFKQKACEEGLLRKFETIRIIEKLYLLIGRVFLKIGYHN